jgi:hypothetical protein
MTPHPPRKILRCVIYTRKSTEHNLDLEFNFLDAQREACEPHIKSQAHEGWRGWSGPAKIGRELRTSAPNRRARRTGRVQRGISKKIDHLLARGDRD